MTVNYIITAKHYSRREGADGTVVGRLQNMVEGHRRKGVRVDLDLEPAGEPVRARIWQGQWIADCECNGAEFVEPTEPIFFCWGCLNRLNGGHVRPVLFPPNREEIEQLVLARPVDDIRGLTDLERAGLARPLAFAEIDGQRLGLSRNWEPQETADDLREQNTWIKKGKG